MKVVINAEYGRFSLDEGVYDYLGLEWDGYGFADISRTDKRLVKYVEEVAEDTTLKVVEIPDNVKWKIEDYDGLEWVAEVHRTWGRRAK